MRVLLASDGSDHAAVAAALVDSIHWPPGTAIEALRAQAPSIVGDAGVSALAAETATDEAGKAILAVAGELEERGRVVIAKRLEGRAADVIVDEAAGLGADLIVMGSRGRGAIASLVLGSVAAEVVDRASCPVLVARTARIESIVLATDETSDSAGAAALLTAWPIFRRARVHVVSVAPVEAAMLTAIGARGVAVAERAPAHDLLRMRHHAIAEEVAGRLRSAGLEAEPVLRYGDPAREIVDAAIDLEADLVLLGSHGGNALARFVLGSVARAVLHTSPTSVLVVRRLPERVRQLATQFA